MMQVANFQRSHFILSGKKVRRQFCDKPLPGPETGKKRKTRKSEDRRTHCKG